MPAVLGHFAQQLTDLSFPLRRFNDRYKIYRQKMHEIESDPEAPQGLASGIVRTAVRAIFIGGDAVPGVRKGLEYVPREIVETQASEWTTYLIKKFSNKDEVGLMREPASILTPLFFEDLNEIAQKQKVLFCFDNFEAASIELLEWLLRIREFKPSLNVRIIIASRDQPGARWDSLRSAIQTVRLDVFTQREAEMFLDVYGITSSKRREEILELTGRLPVLMSWLAVPGGQANEADSSIPTHDIVDRFLRWVDEFSLKQVALLAAVPRTFNADILNLLLEGLSQKVNEQSAFDWLQTMPFVKQGQTGWHYHAVVRRMMLQYQRKKSPNTYHSTHSKLADFYNTRSRELNSSTSEEWTNEQWRKYVLAYIYHFLVADPVRHWIEIMNLFVIAMRKHRSFAIEVIELLNLDDVQDEFFNEQKSIVLLFRQQLHAVEDASLADGFEMFDKLCTISDLSDQAKSYAFAYRGECYRLNEKREKAISDFNSALLYIFEDTWAIARRGQTHLEMQRYEEALVDFERAIALDEKYAWAIASRGVTYREMKRYEEALADLDQAIALDEKDAWAIANRGVTYRAMERNEEALADLERAITLDEKDAWAIAERGDIHRLMGHYAEALADFERAIALDEKDALSWVNRGRVYRMMRQYEKALADLNHGIVLLDEGDAWAFASRGETYRMMRRYEEALADFNRAIALDENLDWAIAKCGVTCRLIGRYEEALTDFNRAIALDEKDFWYRYQQGLIYLVIGREEDFRETLHAAIKLAHANLDDVPDRLSASFNLALFNLVSGNPLAETQYKELISACSSIPHLQDAIDDLDDFLTIQASNELAQHIHSQLQISLVRLQELSTDDTSSSS